MNRMRKITDADLRDRNGQHLGVRGQPDTPGLTAEEMQRSVEQIPREVIIPVINGNADAFETFETENAQIISEHKTATANEFANVREELGTKAKIADLNAHVGNENLHIRVGEREHWNGMTPMTTFEEASAIFLATEIDLKNHNNDAVRHVTTNERERWGAMTPVSEFNNHNWNSERHITMAERMRWNNSSDVGRRIAVIVVGVDNIHTADEVDVLLSADAANRAANSQLLFNAQQAAHRARHSGGKMIFREGIYRLASFSPNGFMIVGMSLRGTTIEISGNFATSGSETENVRLVSIENGMIELTSAPANFKNCSLSGANIRLPFHTSPPNPAGHEGRYLFENCTIGNLGGTNGFFEYIVDSTFIGNRFINPHLFSNGTVLQRNRFIGNVFSGTNMNIAEGTLWLPRGSHRNIIIGNHARDIGMVGGTWQNIVTGNSSAVHDSSGDNIVANNG